MGASRPPQPSSGQNLIRPPWEDVLDVFRWKDGLALPLLGLFLLITGILVVNAIVHDPYSGYDAADHLNYVQSLASGWRLPGRNQTGQYYSPPLPYLLPAALSSLHLGLWKALKLAQVFNVVLAAALMIYLLKICDLMSPGNLRLKMVALGMLGILPVFYRSFALIRGEPYLAFLLMFAAHRSMLILFNKPASTRDSLLLGFALGLALLARQWAFFFILPLVILTALAAPRIGNSASRRVMLSCLIALVIGGWFYIGLLSRFGTPMAFDRRPIAASANSLRLLLPIPADATSLISDPIRPSLDGRALPILYADTWGDYWGSFLVYVRDTNTGRFEQGGIFRTLTPAANLPPNLLTNRFTINRYLGLVAFASLLPSALLGIGFILGGVAFFRFLVGRSRELETEVAASLALFVAAALAGYFWFLIRYQDPAQGGDLAKSTYWVQNLPFLAILGGIAADRLRRRSPKWWFIVVTAITVVFLFDLPAMFTRYSDAASPLLTWALIGSTALLGAGLLVLYWTHSQGTLDHVVHTTPPEKDSPWISICVPARDEQRVITDCMRALLAQTYPHFEVIVVDDRSTDSTRRLLEGFAADPRLHIVDGVDLPEGWAGKPHALHQAVALARGEWLCFVDADTLLAPEAIASCYAAAKSTGADLFSIMTRQVTGSFWERVVLPLVFTALSVGFPPRRVNDPRLPDAIANGQFILIKRRVYDAIGGHAAIKDEIAEDKALAVRVKSRRYRLVLADGRLVAQTRMYTSLPEMWEGWTKNIYLGLRDQSRLLLLGALGVAILALAALFLPLWLILGLWLLVHAGGLAAAVVVLECLLLWTAVLWVRARVDAGLGIPPAYALTTPAGAALFAAMMLSSAWIVLSGRGVTWRGRHYQPH